MDEDNEAFWNDHEEKYQPHYYDPNYQSDLHNLSSSIFNSENNSQSNKPHDNAHEFVSNALKFANNNSAPGYDCLRSIHLKTNETCMNEMLCNLYNTWNNTYFVPYFIRLGSIVSLLKNPDGNTPNDYRPITLLPIIFKTYERLLL